MLGWGNIRSPARLTASKRSVRVIWPYRLFKPWARDICAYILARESYAFKSRIRLRRPQHGLDGSYGLTPYRNLPSLEHRGYDMMGYAFTRDNGLDTPAELSLHIGNSLIQCPP
jgi:hypothetical protein